MSRIIILLFLFLCQQLAAQELFVYTEPASNMAAKSIGIRATNMLMKDEHSSKNNYYLLPEIMWGASKKIMVHGEAILSNTDGSFAAKGASVYAKYRFYSADEVHNHFRMAAFGRYSFNNSKLHEEAVNLTGHNSGYEAGLIATQLIHKVALSASSSFLHAMDNGDNKFLFGDNNRNAIAYTLSVGKLMLPKKYISYKQTNMNLMLEFIGQTNLGSKATFIDIAPSVQFIFNSTTRLDIGYRYPLIKDLYRSADDGILLRLEYNLFNVY